MPSRTIRWLPSLDPGNAGSLASLEGAMANYYGQRQEYYEDIDFSANNWKEDPVYGVIADRLGEQNRLLEIGCGRANLLGYHPELAARYTGADFSRKLLTANAARFPGATFLPLGPGGRLPLADDQFDAVFSIFVLEHCVFPARALKEWLRVLRIGGRFIVLCPDFLGQGRMSSQRAGFTEGNTGAKMRRGAWLDAAVTFWDNRVRIPHSAKRWQKVAKREPQFLVNMAPTCFTDRFFPDVDAVYLTFEPELRAYLDDRVEWQKPPLPVAAELQKKRLILMDGIRKA